MNPRCRGREIQRNCRRYLENRAIRPFNLARCGIPSKLLPSSGSGPAGEIIANRCRSEGARKHTMGNRPRRARESAVGYSVGVWARMSVTNGAKDARMARSRRRWRLLLALLCVVGLVAGGWAWWTYHRYQKRDGGDRIGDRGRSIRDRLPKPGEAPVVEGGPERGNRLPPGVLRAGTGT